MREYIWIPMIVMLAGALLANRGGEEGEEKPSTPRSRLGVILMVIGAVLSVVFYQM